VSFPVIESITPTTTAGDSNHVIDYPATVDANDLLICTFGCDDDETVTFPNEGTDWTVIYRENAGGQGPTLAAAWRKADGTEDGGNFTVTTGSSEGSCAYVFRITGAQDPSTTPPEASTEATGTSANPDSLSLTPSSGSRYYIWISVETNDDDDNVTGYPSNMGDNNQYSQVSTATLGIATVESEGTALDPAQFTLAASEQWEAATISVPGDAYTPPAGSESTTKALINGKTGVGALVSRARFILRPP
jgi:hypothetical protein